jgi:hypothetical protein
MVRLTGKEEGNKKRQQSEICVSRVEQLKVLERLARRKEIVETAVVPPVRDSFEKFPLWSGMERRNGKRWREMMMTEGGNEGGGDREKEKSVFVGGR